MVDDKGRAEIVTPVDYPRLLEERCRGKRDLAARLLKNFLDDSGPRWLAEVKEGVSSGDMAGLARMGHAIKGSCKILYAGAMVRAATRLEDAGKDGSVDRVNSAFKDLERAFSDASQWLLQNPHLLD